LKRVPEHYKDEERSEKYYPSVTRNGLLAFGWGHLGLFTDWYLIHISLKQENLMTKRFRSLIQSEKN
jgi:hypothetical protein